MLPFMLGAGLDYSNSKEQRPEQFYWSTTNHLNPNFSKTCKGFLANWLKTLILELSDLKQIGKPEGDIYFTLPC